MCLAALALALGSGACVASQATIATQPQASGEQPTATDLEAGYLCPMHPDHTSEGPGKCPICGMALVLGRPFDMRDYQLELRTQPAVAKVGETVTLNFTVSHPDTGETVREFETVHDMPYHLFVIGQDLEFFQHIHPQQRNDGRWSIDVVLPKSGVYAVLSDFVPKGGSAQFLARPLVTAGYTGGLLAPTAHLVPDVSPSHTVDDLIATVSFDPPVLRAGLDGHLTFHLTRADTNEPVRELQPYLGAFGHMLIVDRQVVDYVHAHPLESLPPGPVELQQGGPDVMFGGLMPAPGLYRAWAQFRYRDKIYTFPRTFRVYDIGDAP